MTLSFSLCRIAVLPVFIAVSVTIVTLPITAKIVQYRETQVPLKTKPLPVLLNVTIFILPVSKKTQSLPVVANGNRLEHNSTQQLAFLCSSRCHPPLSRDLSFESMAL